MKNLRILNLRQDLQCRLESLAQNKAFFQGLVLYLSNEKKYYICRHAQQPPMDQDKAMFYWNLSTKAPGELQSFATGQKE